MWGYRREYFCMCFLLSIAIGVISIIWHLLKLLYGKLLLLYDFLIAFFT